ncbi:MAG: hypothetical protein R3E13_02560 [Alphaproteobacteria bacterium]
MNYRFAFWGVLFFFVFYVFEASAATAPCSGGDRRRPIEVSLNFEIAEPYILQDRSFKQINSETEESRKKWIEDNGLQEVWSTQDFHTLGYAAGGMAANYITSAYAMSRAYRTYYCAYYRQVEVNIIYRTLIRIPKEIRKGSCKYNVILEHELRHDKANRESFREYMVQLKKDLPRMAAFYERRPVNPGEIEGRFKVMRSSIQEAVNLYIKDFVLPSAEKINQEIDSPESYEADGKKIEACSKRR